MNFLVTGSAGFIGSSFVRQALVGTPKHKAWLGPNDRIVSLDLLTYAASLENLAPVKKDSRHTFVKGDICDHKLVESLVKEHRPDCIINFAAESHVDRSIESSEPFARTNVMGTVNLLDLARANKIRFVQVSTDEVYGSLGPTGSFTELTPMAPNSPYSASKAAADCFVRSYFETHKLECVITRCSNNYGPYQFPEKFLPLSITRLLADQKIPVYGKGNNVRDWLHVEDHSEGVYLCAINGRPGEVYNFGGFGEEQNIVMAKKLIALLGKNEASSLSYVDDRKGHDFRYSMDSKKAQSELGWAPRYSLDEGLKDLVSWYQNNRAWWEPKLPRPSKT
jgi:dTDP-glucose 4,6-dehydratase